MKPFSLVSQTLPARLSTIAQPPVCLNILSNNWEDLLSRPAVAIVGSRRPSRYGREITRRLAGELASQGIVIVSGLAYGVDSEAHSAALEAGGVTIAVLPASLQSIYPASHRPLAQRIVKQGGALVSEYDDVTLQPHKHQFIERNRLISGLSQIVIVTEASLTSGSRHTIDFALDQGRTVMAVPGRLGDSLAEGPLQHLFDGAILVRHSLDVLSQLGLQAQPITGPRSHDADEQTLLNLLASGGQASATLLQASHLAPAVFNQKITMLEINGLVRHAGQDSWCLA